MVQNKKILTPSVFYLLSWTWGILMSFIGLCGVGCIKLYGRLTNQTFQLEKHGYCYYMSIGETWGGVNFGMFFFTDSHNNLSTRWHEHGHAIQNCFWGPLMPFVVSIPSAVRYWKRFIEYTKTGKVSGPAYDSVWFENDATLTGRKYQDYFKSVT